MRLFSMMIIESNISFLYHTNHGSKTNFDCFYAYIIDDLNQTDRTFLRTNYLTLYCPRPLSNDSIGENLTLIQNLMKLVFTIVHHHVSSFNNRKQYHEKFIINTCYPYLSGCYHGPEPMCLDWREICNGIIDCIGDSFGMDQQYCDELEMNECKEDEYRCHNGAQCLPLGFFRDGWTSKDYLDGIDEDEISINSQVNGDVSKLDCIRILTFPCEERSCRSTHSFPCGDEECHETYPENCLLNNSQHFPCESKKNFLSPDCISNQDSFVNEFLWSTFALLCDDIFYGIYDDDENDESNCEWWPCYNPYTRCDTIFQCANGIDEMGCPNTNCSVNELKCDVNDPANSQCIRQAYIYEKSINCSKDNTDEIIYRRLFYSTNLEYLPWKENTCLRDNDICGQQSINTQHLVCNIVNVSRRFTCDKLILNIHNNEPLCALKDGFSLPRLIRFLSVFNLGYFPSTINITSASSPRQHIHIKKKNLSIEY
ncbi:unnamed protein product [Rotaria sp. Silwood2]|nr:unnamed protein product [Rotaria sp. Silwood2]